MDVYKVLKVPVDAKQIDIDRAYQKALKEAQYDPTIQVKEVEIAYRILSDSTQRAIYDAKKGHPGQPTKIAKSIKASLTKSKSKKAPADIKKREKMLSTTAMSLFAIAILYFFFRFGYNLKSFDEGNKIYFKDDDRLFGTLIAAEENHQFTSGIADAYQMKLPSEEIVWFPSSDVKILCYGKKEE